MPSETEMVPSDYRCPFCLAGAMVVRRRVRVIHVEHCPMRTYLAGRGIVPQRYQRIRKDRLERLSHAQ